MNSNHLFKFKANCAETVDQNGYCSVTKHFPQCESPRTSRNSIHRPAQRQLREHCVHLAEENPIRKTREIIKEGMLRIPEFRSPTGGLAAGAAETSGITKRREGQSVKNVKNIIRGGDSSLIPERLKTITGNFPCKLNGQNQVQAQADEKTFLHEKDNRIYCFVKTDLDFLEGQDVYADGTFKLSNAMHNYQQLYTLSVKFQSQDGRRAFCYPVLQVFLMDKSERTYIAMLNDVKDFYRERHARELKIRRIHADREVAWANAVQTVFPDTILLMCSVHIDRTLEEKGLEYLGSIWRNDEALKVYKGTIKKVFFLPFENQGVREKFYQYLNSIVTLVEGRIQKENAKLFATYFHEWLLEHRSIGIRNINYQKAYLDDQFDGDLTNNTSESLNHQLNTRIPPGRLTLARAIEALHDLKIDQISQLVAVIRDETNMSIRSEVFLAKRVLLRRKIQTFDSLSPELQANRTLRYVFKHIKSTFFLDFKDFKFKLILSFLQSLYEDEYEQ